MFIYLLCFLLILGIPFIKNKKYTIVVLLLLSFIMGFRDMIGSKDIYNYAYSYEVYGLKEYLQFDTSEPGFKIYTLFLKLISNNRYFYFFVTSFVLVFFQIFSCYRINNNKGLYLALFIILCKFYLFDFVYLRQLLAISLAWFAFSEYYLKNKKWEALGWYIFAALFHRSALILIPTFFLFKVNIKLKNIIIIYLSFAFLIVSGIWGISQKQLFLHIAYNIPYLEKLIAYIDINSPLKWLYLIEIPPVIAILFYLNKVTNLEKHKKQLLYNSVFFYGLFSIISIQSTTLIRLSWFFFLGLVTAVVWLYREFTIQKFKPYLFSFIILYYSLIFFRILISYDSGDFMPYKSIFDTFERNGKFEHYEYRNN